MRRYMDLVDQLTHLLPIEPPFELLRVEKDADKQQVHLYLQVSKDHLPSPRHSVHSHYDRTWEHLKLFEYRSFIHCSLPIYRDRDTGTLTKASVGFARDYSRFTLLYEQEVMRLMGLHHCLSAVARQLGVRVQRIEAIYHFHTRHLLEQPLLQVCPNVGYDETSTRKGHDYITTFVDLDTAQVIDIQDGKAAEAVEKFFQGHPYPEAVRNISIDMSPAFISGAGRFFPQAALTFDKWHVIRLLYRHLDRMGRKAGPFGAYIGLLMEDLAGFFRQQEAQKAKAQLCFIADFAQERLGPNPISGTIRRHFQGIANYFDSRLTNGLLEGINSKIQLLKRIARGFRDKDNFKKMIRFAFSNNKLSSNFI